MAEITLSAVLWDMIQIKGIEEKRSGATARSKMHKGRGRAEGPEGFFPVENQERLFLFEELLEKK